MSLKPAFWIEPMQVTDVSAVVTIEQLSYSMTWPRQAYYQDLQKNKQAHYFVARADRTEAEAAVIGVGGFWLIVDEIHIMTIAIHPAWRGLGLGEWMLWTLIEQGRLLGGVMATLEVRPSNRVAQSLYQKYQFREVGRRPNYYSDNGEDALIFTTPSLTSAQYQALLTRRHHTLMQRLAETPVQGKERGPDA